MSVVDWPVPLRSVVFVLPRVPDAPPSPVRARLHRSPSRPSATRRQEGAPVRFLRLGARAFIPMALAGALFLSLAPATPVAAASPAPRRTEAQQIIRIAKHHIGARYRWGAMGPRR